MVNGLLSILTGIIVLFPFIITIGFLIGMRRMGKAPAAVIGKAADFTTPFLFLSVYFTSLTIFGKGNRVLYYVYRHSVSDHFCGC